ncbi:MAG: SMP-30/gluconolactonase/LRE family protein [Bacteroidetes bacterium]|nr:SMP-30/gluconolactonase/LRE family protein [Bacteroidota bacterium]
MIKQYTLLCLLLALFNSYNIDGQGKVAYKINQKDLFPEGIAYSSLTNSFYVSSIKKTKILQINASNGKVKDFIASNVIGMSILGIAIDDQRKLLWACANISKNNKRISSIVKFNLSTGKLIKSFERINSFASTYNDLVIDHAGNVYFTDTDNNVVYKIESSFDSVYVFISGKQIEQPNGITISNNNGYLYVASQTNGIRIIDIKSKEIIDTPNTVYNTKGIDGLKFYKNSLIGIQNGVNDLSEINICRYFLNDEGTKIIMSKIIDKNNPNFEIPTTFVIVQNKLFCIANSQFDNFDFSDYSVPKPNKLKNIIILRYDLR